MQRAPRSPNPEAGAAAPGSTACGPGISSLGKDSGLLDGSGRNGTGGPGKHRPVVAIFRQNLFRISEPFITQQAQHLQRYEPVYLGRLRFGRAPDSARSLALRDLGRWRSIPQIGWQMATRSAGPFRRLLREVRPSLVHAHFGIDGVHALPLARRLGIPLIVSFHGFDATLSTAALLCSPAWINYPLFRRELARDGDLFLCVSAYIRSRVLAMGFPDERTLVHYTGVDCGAIRPRDPHEETPTILHVARLVEMKGTEYLIRAFAKLGRGHPEIRLVIAGDGPLRWRLRALAGSLGLEQRVDFLGALPHAEVLAQIRRAAMLVLPSTNTRTGRVEGLGMVLLEAAATGVPVVASRVGGIPEVVEDLQTGLLVPERDVEALHACMARLLNQPETRRQLGASARALVEERFDIRAQGRKLEALYDGVLARRR